MKNFSELLNAFFGAGTEWSIVKIPSEGRDVFSLTDGKRACVGIFFNERDARVASGAPALLNACVGLLERIEVLECDLTMVGGDQIDPIEFLRSEVDALNDVISKMERK